MSKVDPLTPINASYTGISKLNAHLDKIEAGFDNTLSRDGSSPNQMEADIDMNDNQLINVAEPSLAHNVATKSYVDSIIGALTGIAIATGHAWAKLTDGSLTLANYTAARALTSLATNVTYKLRARATKGDRGDGTFYFDESDTTSADNGGTILVTADGGRLKRFCPNDIRRPEWFGDCTSATGFPQAVEDASASLPLGGITGNIILSTDYTSSRQILITQDHRCLKAEAPWGASITWTHASDNGVKCGSDSAIKYNIRVEGITFVASVTQTSGVCVQFKNVVYGGVSRVRIFGGDKIWSGVEFYSCTEVEFEDMEMSEVQRFQFKAHGSNNNVTTANGKCQGVYVKGRNYLYRGNNTHASATITTDGSVVVGPHVEAFFNDGAFLIGGIPNNATGLLSLGDATHKNVFLHLGKIEIETTGTTARGVHVSNSTSVFFDEGWAGGNNTNGMHFTSSASDVVIGTSFDCYINGTTPASAVHFEGPYFRFYGLISDYQGTTHTGISFNATTAQDFVLDGCVIQCAVGIAATNVSSTTSGWINTDIGTSNTAVETGLNVASNIRRPNQPRGTAYLGGKRGTHSLQVTDFGATTVNYTLMQGSAAGGSPQINYTGTDTDVGVTYITKGAGNVNFKSNNGGNDTLTVQGQTTANSGLIYLNASASTVNFEALGGSANYWIVLKPKGSGSIIPNLPTSSAGQPSGAMWNDAGTVKIVP